jgi:hypothetical protein
VTEARRRDGRGEGAVERGHVDELDALADAALAEVGVGQEEQLQRRHRALDRHLAHVRDEASTVERGQGVRQRAAPSSV